MIPIDTRPSLTAWRDAPRKRGGSKYNNIRTVLDGITFDSKAEAKRWAELRLLEKAKRISKLRRQVPYELVPPTSRPSGGKERGVTYIADFVYLGDDGREVVEDVKGASPDVWVIKRKLMLWRHGVEVVEVRA